MSRTIAFIIPHHGHVNTNIGLLKELRRQGEEVICYCGKAYGELIKATGVEFRAFRLNVERFLYAYDSGKDGFDTISPEDKISTRYRCAESILKLNQMLFSSIPEEVRSFKPDYLIYDSLAYGVKWYARELGIPAVCIDSCIASTSSMMEKNEDYYYTYFFGLSSEDRAKTDGLKIKKLIREHEEDLGRRYGLQSFNIHDFYYSEDLNIAYTIKELQPFRELLWNNFVQVGYQLQEQEGANKSKDASTEGRPLIYITRGSFRQQGSHKFYEMCINAFKDSQYRILITSGHEKVDYPEELIPENIKIMEFVDQIAVLSEASVFVTHGGLSGVRESLLKGVPMVVCPSDFNQIQAAEIIKEQNAGVYLENDELGENSLRESVDKVLNNNTYRENAIRLGESLKAAGGYQAAVEHIIKLSVRS